MIPIVLALSLSLAGATPPQKKARGKEFCSARELRGQDCRLVSGDFHFRLLSDTIARDDGSTHLVDPMPLKGEGIEWEKMHFTILAGQPILQLWIWDKGQGETAVQNLHWYVVYPGKTELKILGQGVVRRRHLKPEPPPEEKPAPAPVAKGAKPAPAKALEISKPKPQYIYDAWEKHSLRALKNGDLEWELSGSKKVLTPKP